LHHRQPTTGCAIFPSVKPQRGLFATEASLFHDLSTLLTPQFHHAANIRHHLASLLADRATNRVSFAVSQASADDLAAYFGDDGRTFVAHPGVTWPAGYAARAARSAPPFAGQPYVLVLGTREPRKNLACLFTALRAQPTLLDRARVVIAGKAGWMDRHESFDPRIIFTGYVSQFRKFCLLRHAVALIYPSLFEGFGLPVLESLSVGTPCVVSFSSALPEIGGALCRYFDPCSPQSLAAALAAMLESPRNAEDDAARAAAVAGYTWDAMAARMLLHLSEVGA
jgi:glycosyltransferase involved in cell wall biosynthesis